MRHSLRFLFIFFLSINSYSQYHFKLTGSAPNTLEGFKIYLMIKDNYSGSKFEKDDSAIISNGNFSFHGYISKPCEESTIMLKDKGSFFYFVLDSGNNIMEIKKLPPKWPFYKNKLSNTRLINSISNIIYDSLRNVINTTYLNLGRPTYKENRIIELDSDLRKALWFNELKIIEKYPSQYYSLIYLFKLLLQRKQEISQIERVFNLLEEDLKQSVLGKDLAKKIHTILSSQIGSTIVKFSAFTNAGVLFTNESLVGKIYLIVFGATWCKPCKEHYPKLKRIYSKYSKIGFEIIAINLDDKKELWIEQIEKYKLNWLNISELLKWEESSIIKQFSINYVPFYLLIDEKGIIIYNSTQIPDSDLNRLESILVELIN